MKNIDLKTNKFMRSRVLFIGLITAPLFVLANDNTLMQVELSFENAVKIARKNDPWINGNIQQQKSIESMSEAVQALPDPKISLGLANLPTNGFDFSQEGMTQAKIGVSQLLPRGDTLALKGEQLKIQSEAFPFQRADRVAKVAVIVGSLWLDAYKLQQSITLIKANKVFFEQLIATAESSYSSSIINTNQQNIINAQLELIRLEESLDKLSQEKHQVDGVLSQWLMNFTSEQNAISNVMLAAELRLNPKLPQIDLIQHEFIINKNHQVSNTNTKELIEHFTIHPSVVAIEKKVLAAQSNIKIAKQKYQSQWEVNASYGYRADDAFDKSRANLFSVGVTFDLPLFTGNKQDKELQSAVYQTEAVKTEKILLLRQLLGAFSSAKGRLISLKKRQRLYKQKLIPQTMLQAENSLAAYTNNTGAFTDVLRSKVLVLSTEIDALSVDVEEQKINLELNYLFAGQVSKWQASHLGFSNELKQLKHSSHYPKTMKNTYSNHFSNMSGENNE